jgi:hypothetical protein
MLAYSDAHFPWQDETAWQLMLKVGKALKPDLVINMGDMADFYTVSSHLKHPDMPRFFHDEVVAVNQGLDEIDHYFPLAEKVYIVGNHEHRFPRRIIDRVPELHGSIDWTTILGVGSSQDALSTMFGRFEPIPTRPRWTLVPYTKDQSYRIRETGMIVRHEPLAGGANHAMASLREGHTSILYGHVHQIQRAESRRFDTGESLISLCAGWLGDVRHAAFSYLAKSPSWRMGFVTAVCRGRNIFPEQHEIIAGEHEYSCRVGSKMYVQKVVA